MSPNDKEQAASTYQCFCDLTRHDDAFKELPKGPLCLDGWSDGELK
jgi:hypothetical protein